MACPRALLKKSKLTFINEQSLINFRNISNFPPILLLMPDYGFYFSIIRNKIYVFKQKFTGYIFTKQFQRYSILKNPRNSSHKSNPPNVTNLNFYCVIIGLWKKLH